MFTCQWIIQITGTLVKHKNQKVLFSLQKLALVTQNAEWIHSTCGYFGLGTSKTFQPQDWMAGMLPSVPMHVISCCSNKRWRVQTYHRPMIIHTKLNGFITTLTVTRTIVLAPCMRCGSNAENQHSQAWPNLRKTVRRYRHIHSKCNYFKAHTRLPRMKEAQDLGSYLDHASANPQVFVDYFAWGMKGLKWTGVHASSFSSNPC